MLESGGRESSVFRTIPAVVGTTALCNSYALLHRSDLSTAPRQHDSRQLSRRCMSADFCTPTCLSLVLSQRCAASRPYSFSTSRKSQSVLPLLAWPYCASAGSSLISCRRMRLYGERTESRGPLSSLTASISAISCTSVALKVISFARSRIARASVGTSARCIGLTHTISRSAVREGLRNGESAGLPI